MVTQSAAEQSGVRGRVVHGSVTVERRFPVSPARVFAAFSDEPLRARWFRVPAQPGTGYHELDFRVGGGERSGGTFVSLGLSERVEYRSQFLDIETDERIVFVYEILLDGRRRTVSLVTVQLTPDGDGTLLSYTEQYTLLGVDDDGQTAAAHQRGSIPLLLNGLAAALKDAAS